MTARAFTHVAALALVAAGCARPANESSLARGKRMFDEGRWDTAIESLSAAIAQDPLDAEAYLYRGRAYHCRGREHLGQAIFDFNEAIRLNPSHCEAYYSRAEAYKEKGDRDKALADSLRARRLDPNYASASNMYSSSTDESFRRVLERVQPPEKSSATTGNVSTDTLLDSVSEDLPRTSPRSTDGESATGAGSKAQVSSTSRARSISPDHVRDAYGLPVSTERSGSVTEELFGAGRRDTRANGGASPNRIPSLGPFGNRTFPDWQANAPLPTAPPLDSQPPQTARKPSPVGTLPFGNPYQPQGASASPYSPVGPRSTGLQGDPTLRQPRSPYDRRYNRNAIPAGEFGLPGPLAPPP